MDPRAIVAIILSVGVMLALLSGTPLRYLWSERDAPLPTPEAMALWRDILLLIVGALVGYITGSNKQ